MKNDLKFSAFLAVLTLCGIINDSRAAGFSLYEGSARGNADAAGLTAKGGSPSALFFNSAAISDLKGDQIEIGATFVLPYASVDAVNPYTGAKLSADGHDKIWALPNFYYTHQINDDFVFGIGGYTRAGLGANFSRDWLGRYNNASADIISFAISPNLSWRVNDWLAVSAGISANYFNVELCQNIDLAGATGLRNYNDPSYSPYDVWQTFKGDDYAPGYELGLQIKPTDKLYMGAAFHSRVEFKCEGEGYWQMPAAVRAMVPGMFNKTGIKGDITLPDIVMTALSYDLTDKLTVGLGVTYTGWHTFDTLSIRMDTPELMGRAKASSKKEWDDCWRYTGGFSYKALDNLVLRAAYTYDESPLNEKTLDYLVPADDRHIFAVGAGWDVNEALSLDFSYFYEIIVDRSVAARVSEGVYDSEYNDGTAHSFAVSATYRF